jgi:ribosomal protein S18 acetylase RimI-like enzyme
MIDVISYRVNFSSVADIAFHLLKADVSFKPFLSRRVDIHAYSNKLHDKAIRFEAWLNQDLVGLVAVYCNQLKDGKAFLSSISVWPECQGLGIATRLMRDCIDHLEVEGFYHLALEVDRRSKSALSLYRKLGFISIHNSGTLLLMEMKIKRKNK